jgi:hypothetical protein
MPPNTISRAANGHDDIKHTIGVAEDQCPWCGAPITRKEFKAIRARMAAEEAERSAKREQQIREGFARETAKAEAAKKAEVEKARKEAATVADKKIKLLRANQDAVIAARLETEREKAAKKLGDAVSAEKLAHAAEKLRLETALSDMQRRL